MCASQIIMRNVIRITIQQQMSRKPVSQLSSAERLQLYTKTLSCFPMVSITIFIFGTPSLYLSLMLKCQLYIVNIKHISAIHTASNFSSLFCLQLTKCNFIVSYNKKLIS